jgi:hypothetical protein
MMAGACPPIPSSLASCGAQRAPRGACRNKAIRALNRQTLEVVGAIGGHAGHNAREFFHIHSFASDSKGNLFLGEVNNGQRYYKYGFKGMGSAPLITSTR